MEPGKPAEDSQPKELHRRLHVALLSPCFWPEVRRGGERFVRDLADGLIAHGQRPQLITSHPAPPTRRIEDGLPVLRLPRPPQGRLLRRHYLPYLTHLPFSYLALRVSGPDLAHAVYPSDALAAARWRRRTGRAVVFSYLGIPDRRGLVEHRRGLSAMVGAVRGSDAVVALSRHAAAAFERWLGVQAHVIPPGVDLERFRPAAARATHPTIICTAAATVPRKNVGLLVEAFGLLRRELPEARLVLSRPSSLAAAVAAGVAVDAPGVEWRALDDEAALAGACAEAWVAVLPSVDEAFGLVLAEALACGTPVVGYDDAAIPEIIDSPAVGRLFARLDARALADALLEGIGLTGDPATAGRCRTRAAVFSLEAFTGRYLELYRTLAP